MPINIKFLLISVIIMLAAIFDIMYRRIPNLLIYPSMGIGLVLHVIYDGGIGILFSSGGLVLGTSLFAVPWLIGAMGAGDAKLVGAIGAFVGPKGIIIVTILTYLAGGIYALLLLLINRNRIREILKSIKNIFIIFALTKKLELGSEKEHQGMPKQRFGIAIAFGTIAYMVMEIKGIQLF